MNHRFRQALRLILLMAGLCLAWSGTAQDDDVNDLLATLRDQVAFEAQLVTDLADPDLHEAERAGKQEQLDNARLQIGRLREAIAKAGIMVEIRPGGIVEVKDPSSGASDRRPAASPCAKYKSYQVPGTSIYTLPRLDRQSGASRELARLILATEQELAQHTIHCEEEWTSRESSDWDARRTMLAELLLDMELRYALRFAPALGAAANNAISAAQTIEQRDRAEREQLWGIYLPIHEAAEDLRRRFRLLPPDPPTVLRAQQLMHQELVAWRNYSAAVRTHTASLGTLLQLQSSNLQTRIRQGVQEMIRLHPGTRFSLHTKAQFLDDTSTILEHLVGEFGIDVLKAEGARRYLAVQRAKGG